MGRIDKLEAQLSEAADQKAEIEAAKARCLDACRHEFAAFAKECERGGGNPGLELALGGLEDLLNDMAHDSLVKLNERIDAASLPLNNEYRSQGVA